MALSGPCFSELVVARLAVAAERRMVTDPTGTPLRVRWFDGKVIGLDGASTADQ
jgi:hypothetical protein